MIGSCEEAIVSLQEFKLQDTSILSVYLVKIYTGEIMKKYLPDNLDFFTAHALEGLQNYSLCTFNIIQQLKNGIAIMHKQIGVSE